MYSEKKTRLIPRDFKSFTSSKWFLKDRKSLLVHDHIAKYIGRADHVIHYRSDNKVLFTIYWIRPNRKNPYHTFITYGLSRRLISQSKRHRHVNNFELCIILPNDYPFSKNGCNNIQELLSNPDLGWPIQWLSTTAKYLLSHNKFLSSGDLIPDQLNVQVSNATDSKAFSGAIIHSPKCFSKKFIEMQLSVDENIEFLCLYPLYAEELKYIKQHGILGLLNRRDNNITTDIFRIERLTANGNHLMVGNENMKFIGVNN